MTDIIVRQVQGRELPSLLDDLATLLASTVESGAGVSFLKPFTKEEAATFFETKIFPAVLVDEIILFIAFDGKAVCGTVQLHIAMLPNQPHRCEVAKMMVSQKYQKRGIAHQLMQQLEEKARSLGKALIMLDTVPDSPAEHLYKKMGFVRAGVVPYFAVSTDGSGYDATAYMYKLIGELEDKH